MSAKYAPNISVWVSLTVKDKTNRASSIDIDPLPPPQSMLRSRKRLQLFTRVPIKEYSTLIFAIEVKFFDFSTSTRALRNSAGKWDFVVNRNLRFAKRENNNVI